MNALIVACAAIAKCPSLPSGRTLHLFVSSLRASVLCCLLAAAPALAGDDLIRLAADEAWQPFIDPNSEDGGLVPDLVAEIFRESGLDTSVAYMAWPRVLRETARGDYQAVAGAYFTEERASKFIYSNEFLRFRVSFIARRPAPLRRYESLSELEGYVIGIVQDAAYPEALFESGLDLHVSNTREGLVRMLQQGRIDMLADTDELFRHHALSQGINPDDFVSLSPPLQDEALFLIAPRALPGSEAVINTFNRGLAELKYNGRYLAIRRAHGF